MGYMRDASGRRLDSFEVLGTDAFDDPDSPSYAALTDVVETTVIGNANIATAVKLPTLVRSEWQGYNHMAPTTSGNYEYVAYARDDLHPVIAQRHLKTGVWVVTDVSAIFGNIASDGHNSFAIAVDGNGYVHLWGNMHASAMLYAKSNAPNSVAAFTAATMIGTQESASSYPNPLTLPNGNLLFTYRDGVSGDGDLYLNRYNTTAGTWTRLSKLIDGTSTSEGVYASQITQDKNGGLHMAYNWRGDDTADSNRDVCYVRSLDGGVTWASITGTAVSLPITHAGSPVIFPTALTGSGLLNTASVTVTDSGKPHLAFLMFDAGGFTNVYHLWWTGSAWTGEFVTFGTVRMSLASGIVASDIARPSIAATRENVFVFWRTRYDGKRDTIRAVDVSVPGAPFEFSIANWDIGWAELILKNTDYQTTGILKFLVTPQPAGGSAGSPALQWQSQWGAILKLDLTRLRLLGSTQAGRPGSVVVGTYALPGATVVSTTNIDAPGMPAIAYDSTRTGRISLVHITGRFNQINATGTGTWSITQRDNNGGNAKRRGELTHAGVNGNVFTGFKVPAVVDPSTMASGGWLAVQASTPDAGGTRATVLAVEIRELTNGDGTFL